MKTRIVIAAVVVLAACAGPRQEAQAAHAQAAPTQGKQYGSLDQLLAPVALYPDQLLAQILLCAGDPGQVTKLDQWVKSMSKAKGSQLQDAAVKAGFDASFVALSLFPQVVTMMASDIQWTTLLGQAFAADKGAVFSSIQRLRHQAQDVGTLKDTPQQDVQTKTTSSGENVIVIEPSNPQVVYVPQYNSTTVYTQAPTTTTVVVQEDNSDAAVAAGMIGFTAGIAMGAAMNNNYYYGPYGYYGGGYMYNDAWDDYYDHREDAREDWADHREDVMDERSDRLEDRSENRQDLAENRGERSGTTQQQRTDRQQNRQENRPETQAQRQERATQAQSASTQSRSSTRTGSSEARGFSQGGTTKPQTASRSGSSDAFSGYSSGKSQRSASSRGQSSRSSSRGGGGRRR
jgi:uncharacterized membrane protein YgcG